MSLFYHHVGRVGAAEDFGKTVFSPVAISTVEKYVPANYPFKDELLTELHSRFPDGFCNCWGVPAGAEVVIRRLKVGDIVLLIESTSPDGEVPALCQVEVFHKIEFGELSRALWGDGKFPYVFFFRTQRLSLRWPEFRNQLGYSESFNPRGQFQSVSISVIERIGGVERFVDSLLREFGAQPTAFAPTSESDAPKLAEAPSDYTATEEQSVRKESENEMRRIIELSNQENPSLTDELERHSRTVSSFPRASAFSSEVKRLYGSRCAICGLKLTAPSGEAEVQAAHIYPKALNGSDNLRNALCLCRMHHWAIDAGWISFSDDWVILVRDGLPTSRDYDFIRDYAGRRLRPPDNPAFSPHQLFLSAHRRLRGFE